MKRVLIVMLTVLSVSGMTGCGYNTLQSTDENINATWSEVVNQYQRRADLIPNLVETVKGAADFERETFTAITEARARVGQMSFPTAPTAEQLQAFEAAQDSLSSALSRLLVVVENYPNLTATQAFRDLQVQLEGTENRISVERRKFNLAVQEYNTARREFPTLIIAKAFDFGERTYFGAREGADEAPRVEF